ncbi:competence protein ComK [Salipaludibacillus sp. CF4.18]|uniref:competence protein ComK n=1 Tax=Salipaludibacillus sp. CF4.18 TaxID=3373081 RepID=UPI003EE54136
MIDNVYKDYKITKNTQALLPSYRSDSSTLVFETGLKIYVKQNPLEIIKAACLDGFSTYEGRREAAIYRMGAKRKVPIAICPTQDIYAFPSLSPTNFHCHWLFFDHIQDFTSPKNESRQTIVTFKNNRKLLLSVSPSVLEKQMYRTSLCILRCSQHGQQSRGVQYNLLTEYSVNSDYSPTIAFNSLSNPE